MNEKETRTMTNRELPSIVQRFIELHPDVWEAYNKLGQTAAETGPLDEKAERLVKLAIAVGGGLEGAVRSHTRRGMAAGLSPEELQHVAVLGITTVGWPSAIAAFSWIHDELEKRE
jgi:alkylhydroperoxidase/carboxymuconolactone decarboxylase family protein YurZ